MVFWNLNNCALVEEVAELVVEQDCHLVALSEADVECVEMIIETLSTKYKAVYRYQETPGCDRIRLIVNERYSDVELLNQHRYYSLIKITGRDKGLIIGLVHLPSKLHHAPDEIRAAAEILHRHISEEEERYEMEDSMVVGDFNIDPFEMPMISFSGMCATNAKDSSIRDRITRAGQKRRLFYNPMWALYSAYGEKPGSYRYDRLGEDVVGWHFLDQVIIRPSLIEAFRFDALKLICGTSTYKFVNQNGVPTSSDHLPIACEVEI